MDTSYRGEKMRSNILGPAHIAINVKDIRTSIKFYTEYCGFECYDFFEDGGGVYLAFLNNGSLHMEIVQFPQDGTKTGKPSWKARPFDGPVDHIALYSNNLEELIAFLLKEGVKVDTLTPIEHPNVGTGCRCMFFRGPDGERIEVIQNYNT